MTLPSLPAPGSPAQGGSPTRTTRHRALELSRSLGVLILSLCVLVGVAPHAAAADPPLSSTLRNEVDTILTNLTTRSSPTDPRYLEGTVWQDGTPECFRCTLGPAVLSAQHGVAGGTLDQSDIEVAVATLDTAIRSHQRFDGAFFPAGPSEGGLDIQTVLFANELAQTYLVLGPRLDFAHRRAWARSLTKSADWLIRNKNLTFYTNGNINLAQTINMDLTYRVTRLTRFKSAAARSLAFTLAPPEGQFGAYGLKYSTTPTRADGADGAGYLAESGGEAPGYDPAYTLVQANLAALWFSLTGDATAKMLTNLFYNQLVPRVRTSDWTIDVSGGTRRVAPGLRYRFATSALAVLALKGGRTDLQPSVRPQVQTVLGDYRGATAYKHASLSFGYGSELAPIYGVVSSTPLW